MLFAASGPCTAPPAPSLHRLFGTDPQSPPPGLGYAVAIAARLSDSRRDTLGPDLGEPLSGVRLRHRCGVNSVAAMHMRQPLPRCMYRFYGWPNKGRCSLHAVCSARCGPPPVSDQSRDTQWPCALWAMGCCPTTTTTAVGDRYVRLSAHTLWVLLMDAGVEKGTFSGSNRGQAGPNQRRRNITSAGGRGAPEPSSRGGCRSHWRCSQHATRAPAAGGAPSSCRLLGPAGSPSTSLPRGRRACRWRPEPCSGARATVCTTQDAHRRTDRRTGARRACSGGFAPLPHLVVQLAPSSVRDV